MSIIDKLDKKILDKKSAIKLEDDEKNKLWKKIYNFGGEVYRKNVADDFIKLEKLFNKHIEKDDKVSVTLTKGFKAHLSITELYSDNYHSIQIELDHKDKESVSSFSSETIKEMKAYKFLDTNYHLKVSSEVNENKEFELKNKEKAYEYLNDLFQKEMLLL